MEQNDLTRCDLCLDVFKRAVDARHKNSCRQFFPFLEKKTEGYGCKLCNFIGPSRIKFNNHVKTTHSKEFKQQNKPENPSKTNENCSFCNENVCKDTLNEHIAMCKIIYDYVENTTCLICDYESSTKVEIRDHIKKEHTESLSAHITEVKNDSSDNLSKLEIEEKHDDMTKKDLKKDKLNNEKLVKAQIECQICHDVVQKAGLNEHAVDCKKFNKLIEESKIGFKCLVCNEAHKTRTEVYLHLKKGGHWTMKKVKRPNIIENTEKCKNCNELISSKAMDNHLTTCSKSVYFMIFKDNNYHCTKCDFSSSKMKKVNNHINNKHSDSEEMLIQNESLENRIKATLDLNEDNKRQKIDHTLEDDKENYGTFDSSIIDLVQNNESEKIEFTNENERLYLTPRIFLANILNTENVSTLTSIKAQCLMCKNDFVSLKKHMVKCENLSKFIIVLDHGYRCQSCDFQSSKIHEQIEHIKNEHKNDSSKICKHCDANVKNEDFNQHIDICKEIIKYLEGNSCLVCDLDLDSKARAFEHVREEHLDIICVLEQKNENLTPNAPNINVKKEFIDTPENQEVEHMEYDHESHEKCMICKDIVETDKLKEHENLCKKASEYVHDKNCLLCEKSFNTTKEALQHVYKCCREINQSLHESVNVKTEEIELQPEFEAVEIRKEIPPNLDIKEPKPLQCIFTCPMCFNKYGSMNDVEQHMLLFHRIPIEVQRQSLQKGTGMSIIKQNV